MRVLHGADFHLGLTNFGRPVTEFGESLARFADTAIAEKVDLAVIAGDLFHTRRPGPTELLLAVRPVVRMTEAGVRVVLSGGNHDGAGTIGAPDSHTLGWWAELRMPGCHVATTPQVIRLPFAHVVAVPYAHKRAIESDDDLSDRTAAASRVLEDKIAELAQEATSQSSAYLPLIFVGHLTTLGASLGSEAAMQMGWDTTVDPAVFDAYDLACLGHIHKRQAVSATAFYAGSPDVHGWDDQPAAQKGWWLHDTEAGTHRFIASHPRPFVTVDGAMTPELLAQCNGAVVRLLLAEPLEASAIRSIVTALRQAGAFNVTVVAPPAKRTFRGTAKIAELTLTDQMGRWLDANTDMPGLPPGGVARESVLALAAEVVGSFEEAP